MTKRNLEPSSHGMRPSVGRLFDLVNQAEPEYRARTVSILQDMAEAGVDLDERAIDIALKMGRRIPHRDLATEPPEPSQDGHGAIVYYIRRGDLIKIGTTRHPRKRFEALVPDEIMAFEPGDRSVEFRRHRQFSHLRTGRNCEHFHPGLDLLEHIQRTRAAHGAPDPEWPTMATLGRSSLPDLPSPVSEVMVTIAEAAINYGVKRPTIDGWVRRKRLHPAGLDERGTRLYYAEHMQALVKAHTARQPTGVADSPDTADLV